MAWVGPQRAVQNALAVAHADRGDDGRFIVSGEPLGNPGGGDLSISDRVTYFVRGEAQSLAALMEVRAANPMATADELREQIAAWAKAKASTKNLEFLTVEQWVDRMGPSPWIELTGQDPIGDRGGFIVVSEGSAVTTALAGTVHGRDAIRIYREWEAMLDAAGWWWEALTSWAFQVYPVATGLSKNPGRTFREFRFPAKRRANPIPKGQRQAVRKATKRFDRALAKRLKGENWSLSIREDLPKYTVVVNIESCPGSGDIDRRETEVFEAFTKSGLDKHLYFDGTDFGPLRGPAAAAPGHRPTVCPERGYHFYDASADHPPGLDLGDPGYRAAVQLERQAIAAHQNPNPELDAPSTVVIADVPYRLPPGIDVGWSPVNQAYVVTWSGQLMRVISDQDELREYLTLLGASAENPRRPKKNPPKRRHRHAYEAYVTSARHHIETGIELLEKGDRRAAFANLRHAECDIRHAYTEASYAKDNRSDLQDMTARLENLYLKLRVPMRQLEASL